MRCARLCALALAVGFLTANLAWADDGSPFTNWFGRLLHLGKAADKTPAKEVHEVESAESKPTIASSNAPSPRAQAADDYNRRNDQCLKLEEIAANTGDDALRRKVELLRQRINEIYAWRTQYLSAEQATNQPAAQEKQP